MALGISLEIFFLDVGDVSYAIFMIDLGSGSYRLITQNWVKILLNSGLLVNGIMILSLGPWHSSGTRLC